MLPLARHRQAATSTAALAPFRRVVLSLVGAVVAVSVLDLLGWWLHLPVLVGFYPEMATMKPNTALCLLLLAFAAFQRQGHKRSTVAADVFACCAIALAFATLLEYWTGHGLGIDQLLAHVPAERAGDPVGRMSQGTAIDGLVCGLALLFLDTAPLLASSLTALGGLLSLSALVGFLFDAGPLLGVPILRSMAVRTAAGFAAIQVVCFLLRPRYEPIRSLLHSARHHRMGGWYIAGTVILPLLLGLPAAFLYRHGAFNATFAFSVLVVVLMSAQAFLATANSRSLARFEAKRNRAEEARRLLQLEYARQRDVLVASEQRAAQSEALYRLITDALPAMISYIDTDMRYVRANKAYAEWFGVSPVGFERESLEKVIGPSAASARLHLEAALRGEPQQFEPRVYTVQGDRILNVSYIPDRDVDGSVRGVVVQAYDITGQRKAEAALRQTEKLAAVGKLASSIAHEINNPLESVTNLLYLARITQDPVQVGKYLETAEDELKRVSVIANQTLRFHKQSTRPRPVQASELFESVLAIYRPRLAGSIRLEERHRPADPITCMDGEIRQVLNNLVGNALDAMHGSAGRMIVRSRMARLAKMGELGIVMTVADTGSGMSAKTLAAVFEAFFTTKGMSGTGLGLWVSKEIVDRHNGTLRVRSSQAAGHHGTVFRLFLPYSSVLTNT